jgi:DNA-binding SARP family transcriptional activator
MLLPTTDGERPPTKEAREVVEFRILGAIEVIDADGRSLALGGSRCRAMLAALALEPGASLSRERLIDRLWVVPPASAAHAVSVFASRLRSVLGRQRVRCDGTAYRLELDPAELDLARFRFLVHSAREHLDSGDSREAARLLTEGLAIWRGEALACLGGEPLTADVRAFLEEERLAAVETEIDVRLELGQHHELLAELRRLSALHPNRERLTARLMLALYRSGRQVDALEVFASVRARLHDELAVEPGAELRALQRRILGQDPKLGVGGDAAISR